MSSFFSKSKSHSHHHSSRSSTAATASSNTSSTTQARRPYTTLNLKFGNLQDIDWRNQINRGISEVMQFLRPTSPLTAFSVSNNCLQAWVSVRFGSNPKSAPCKLKLDSGSFITWVSESVYKNICTATGAHQGTDCGKEVILSYNSGQGKGRLYRNSITIGDVTVNDQEFVLVNDEVFDSLGEGINFEGNYLDGIIGFGRSLDKCVTGDADYKIVSVLDKLLQKQGAKGSVVGLNLKIPSDSEHTVTGEVHIGGYKQSLFSPKDIMWVPMSHQGFLVPFSSYMSISYLGQPITSQQYTAFIDTGSPFITIPNYALQNYINEVAKASNNKIKFEYDGDQGLYYISKRGYEGLEDVVLNFNGQKTRLHKYMIILPSNKVRQWIQSVTEGRLYLVFRSLQDMNYIILGQSWVWRYYLIADIANSKVGIAKVKGKTNYIWKELLEK